MLSDPTKSPIGKFCTTTLPDALFQGVGKVFGARGVKVLRKVSEKFMAILYLTIVLGSWFVIFTHCYAFIDRSSHVSSLHKYSGYVVFIACMWSWHTARTTSPGYITERNLVRFDNYPYDDFLFVEKDCPTLGFRKLARSKYDRFTNRHVARFDHFCGFVDNAIGEENYRFFLLFLMIHIGMCIYGTVVTYTLFWGEVLDKNLLNAIFYNGATGEEVQADMFVVCHYLFMKYFALCAVFILMAVMSIVLGLFFSFHLFIASSGMTTNEFYKWRQVKKWHKRAVEKYKRSKTSQGGIRKNLGTEDTKDSAAEKNAQIGLTDDVDIGCTGPLGNAKEVQPRSDTNNEVEDPGPFPVNIYHRGIVENFTEIVFPRSRRSDAVARFRASIANDRNATRSSVARGTSGGGKKAK